MIILNSVTKGALSLPALLLFIAATGTVAAAAPKQPAHEIATRTFTFSATSRLFEQSAECDARNGSLSYSSKTLNIRYYADVPGTPTVSETIYAGSCTYPVPADEVPQWKGSKCVGTYDDELPLKECIDRYGTNVRWHDDLQNSVKNKEWQAKTICVLTSPKEFGAKIIHELDDEACESALGLSYGWFDEGYFGGSSCYQIKPNGQRLLGRQPVAQNLCPTKAASTGRNGTYSGAANLSVDSIEMMSDDTTASGL